MKNLSRSLLTMSLLSALALGAVSPSFAGERLDNIMEKKVLRVGTPGDYRPFSMKEDGKFVGHDIELVQKMADVYGWNLCTPAGRIWPKIWPPISLTWL